MLWVRKGKQENGSNAAWHFTEDDEITLCGRPVESGWIARDQEDEPDKYFTLVCRTCLKRKEGKNR